MSGRPIHPPILFPGNKPNVPWQVEAKNVSTRALTDGMVCRFSYSAAQTGFEVDGQPVPNGLPRNSRIVAGVVTGGTIESGEVGRIARCGLVTQVFVIGPVASGDLLSMSEVYFGAAQVVGKTATTHTSWFGVAYKATSTRGLIPAVLFLRRWFV